MTLHLQAYEPSGKNSTVVRYLLVTLDSMSFQTDCFPVDNSVDIVKYDVVAILNVLKILLKEKGKTDRNISAAILRLCSLVCQMPRFAHCFFMT